jgi:hypothetical protein
MTLGSGHRVLVEDNAFVALGMAEMLAGAGPSRRRPGHDRRGRH